MEIYACKWAFAELEHARVMKYKTHLVFRKTLICVWSCGHWQHKTEHVLENFFPIFLFFFVAVSVVFARLSIPKEKKTQFKGLQIRVFKEQINLFCYFFISSTARMEDAKRSKSKPLLAKNQLRETQTTQHFAFNKV